MRLPALVDLTCQQVTDLVGEYLSAPGLGARDRARFEQHLHACTWCMDYLQQIERTTRATARLRPADVAPVESELLALYRRVSVAGRAATRPWPGLPPARVRARTEPPRRRAGRRLETVRFAFKFLTAAALGPLSGHAWPRPTATRPGAWVESGGRLEPCRVGVHACATSELACWLHDALWLVELDGDMQRCVGGVVATRGRLVRNVAAWATLGALRFAEAAHDHACELARAAPPNRQAAATACIASSARHLLRGEVALTAYGAAMAAARLRGVSHFDQMAFDAERRWQSKWITRELQLDQLLAEAAAGYPGSAPT